MALAIDTLVAAGHQHIALLTGPTDDTPPVAHRVSGALDALARHGIALPPGSYAETPDHEAASARDAVRGLLTVSPGFTAIACTGDILALGAIMAIREQGLSVPDDVSIVGCSDSIMAQYVDPPLTTIHLPFRRMGEIAAEQLVLALAGRSTAGLRFMPFHLETRCSVATPQIRKYYGRHNDV